MTAYLDAAIRQLFPDAVNGETYSVSAGEDGVPVISYWDNDRMGGEPDAAALSAAAIDMARAHMRAAVDAAAERERLKYITGGEGQAMTYQAKYEEAVAIVNDQAPASEDYPLLAAELGITGATLADVATVVLAARASWAQIGAAIEAVRLGAKKAIAEAADEATAEAAFNAVEWPAAD